MEGKNKNGRSYQPVALTNILCKMFEKITRERLLWYLKKEKLDYRQVGFRKQKSTINTISKITTNFYSVQKKGENSQNLFRH